MKNDVKPLTIQCKFIALGVVAPKLSSCVLLFSELEENSEMDNSSAGSSEEDNEMDTASAPQDLSSQHKVAKFNISLIV